MSYTMSASLQQANTLITTTTPHPSHHHHPSTTWRSQSSRFACCLVSRQAQNVVCGNESDSVSVRCVVLWCSE